jgi:hypothetical protein
VLDESDSSQMSSFDLSSKIRENDFLEKLDRNQRPLLFRVVPATEDYISFRVNDPPDDRYTTQGFRIAMTIL